MHDYGHSELKWRLIYNKKDKEKISKKIIDGKKGKQKEPLR